MTQVCPFGSSIVEEWKKRTSVASTAMPQSLYGQNMLSISTGVIVLLSEMGDDLLPRGLGGLAIWPAQPLALVPILDISRDEEAGSADQGVYQARSQSEGQ